MNSNIFDDDNNQRPGPGRYSSIILNNFQNTVPMKWPQIESNPLIANEFISIENNRNRGRFELAFVQIGGMILAGSTVGAAIGLRQGWRSYSLVNTNVRRTQMLNYAARNAGQMANRFGMIALTYSVLGVGLDFVVKNDNHNTIASSTATGGLYGAFTNSNRPIIVDPVKNSWKMTKIKRIGIGSLLGFLAANVYINLIGSH